MSLLLCRQEKAKHPFYVDFIGIYVHTLEELCYVMYQYPMLVLDGFVDDGLLAFLRDELGLGFLAMKLERWKKSGENPDEQLLMILQECDYYYGAEINRYRQQLAAIRKKHPAEYKKLKADELFLLRQYGKAVELYRELLEYPADSYVDDLFYGRIWNNTGSCYARMFQLEKAFGAYEKAYNKTQDRQVLERLYLLSRLDEKLVLGDRCRSLITSEMAGEWDEKIKTARETATQSPQLKELEALFQKDSLRRLAGAEQLITQWKQEYRTMA